MREAHLHKTMTPSNPHQMSNLMD